MSSAYLENSEYRDDPRVVSTTHGLSFSRNGKVYYIKPDDGDVVLLDEPNDLEVYEGVRAHPTASAAWNIVTADGDPVGSTDDPDAAMAMFLGPPQSMAVSA